MNENKREKQHTVPQFILKNFATNNILYTYDKTLQKYYRDNVKSSCCEKSFYDFNIEVEGEIKEYTLENFLSEIERKASHIIRKIIEKDSVKNISNKDRDSVVKFLASQMCRTLNIKQNYKKMPEQLRNVIIETMSKKGNNISINEKFSNFNKENLNLFFNLSIVDITRRIEPYFKDLEWILVKTDENNPFFIGDSPVVVFNELYHYKKGPFDFIKYSIAYKGSCVFFPISPTRALWLVSPEVIEKYVASTDDLLSWYFLGISFAVDVSKMSSKMKEFIDIKEGFTKTKSIAFSQREVDKFNFLEITRAERKVFSKFPDFKLVDEIINSDDFYRHGMRILCN